MTKDTEFLDKAYDIRTPEDTRALYDDWAGSYDAELEKNGYATPGRCAEALIECGALTDAPLLDFGCGTGVSGVALSAAGFTSIDGVDLSEGMLEKARERGIYRRLTRSEPDKPLPAADASYDTVAAVGVISPSAAPAACIDMLIAALRPGGLFVLSFNDHALEDPAFEGRIAEYVDCGAIEVLLRENGPHLPGIGLEAIVYVLKKR